jgi:hypothetical protein
LRRWQGLAGDELAAMDAILTGHLKNLTGHYKAVRGNVEVRQGQVRFKPESGGHGSRFALLRQNTAYTLISPAVTELAPGARIPVRCPDLPLTALPLLGSEPP